VASRAGSRDFRTRETQRGPRPRDVNSGVSARQMNPDTPALPNSLPRLVAWGAVFGSTLPEIIWQESGHPVSCWFTITVSLLLLATALLAVWVPSLRALTRFLIAVALLNFAWRCL